MAACAMPPGSSYYRDYDQPYGDEYYDYRGTPMYEGYYYARIIFIGNIPYYVDDYRNIRPIPPRLYDHFRMYPYSTLGPPVFSRDRGMRDGYPLSSIIYLNNVPYNVGINRIAQPLPERLRPHFRYPSSKRGNDPRYGTHTQPFGQHDNSRNNDPSFYEYDQDSDLYRSERGMNRPDREQPGPFGNTQSKGGEDSSADTRYRTTPAPDDSHNQQMRQAPSNAGESHSESANGTKADKQKSHKQDNQGDSTQADDGSDKGNAKKSRDGNDDDQEDDDRSNNRRD